MCPCPQSEADPQCKNLVISFFTANEWETFCTAQEVAPLANLRSNGP